MTGKLTKSQSKFVNSLKQKKYRDLNRRFVAEGIKVVQEAIEAEIPIDYIVYTGDEASIPFPLPENSVKASERELGQISSLKTPNRVLAVCKMQTNQSPLDFEMPIIALDGISDPGNLGTIIRLCDWFGFGQLVCGDGTVDMYNSKVVQATMGSLFRVNIRYENLTEMLAQKPSNHPVYYADMYGNSIYESETRKAFTLVMGSESHGVSEAIRQSDAIAISIPRYGAGESLNVAIATGIICGEFKRRLSK